MKRVLIVKLSSLGDLFHALPAVHALKEGLDARIDWATQPEYVGLVRCFNDVDEVLPVPRRNRRTQYLPFIRRLRENRYDYVIDLQGLMKSAVVVLTARGDRKIGPSASRECTRLFYPERAGKKNKQRHAVEELMDVVRYLGRNVPDELQFPVTFPVQPDLGPGRHIALCPCSRAAGKNWPPGRFAQTARQLLETPDTTIHLVGSPDDRAECKQISDALPAARNHAGKTSLLELGGLLAKMDLLITVDSGPMHMAAAIGTPTLALFGPTAPLRTGPYGPLHRVIESPFQSDRKRISKKTRQQDMRYIKAITVEEVVAAASRMLDG
jgi:lipopolysaccharide heptosyltransferase I